jgi:hypothetical protein
MTPDYQYPPIEYTINVEDVELDCHFDYEPEELNYPDAPNVYPCMNLLKAYIGKVDIAHILMQSVVDELCEIALKKYTSESDL